VPTIGVSKVGVEILDDPAGDPALVRRMLRDIAVANRWFGARHAVRHALNLLIDGADRGRCVSLFDVGTGAGDLPLDAVRWAARRGITLHPIGLERIPAAARLARDAGVPTMLGCAGALPLRRRSVDLVLVSQVAHHLDAESAALLFADCTRVARRGVIVADLRPSALAALGFRLGGTLLGLHQTTIEDGVTSLARGFTPTALHSLCAGANPAPVTVSRMPFSRVVAWWRTDQ
jgi:SAM-dependent methyltransferase